MEMLPLFIYLAGIVDQINTSMTIVSIILVVVLGMSYFYICDQENKIDPDLARSYWKR